MRIDVVDMMAAGYFKSSTAGFDSRRLDCGMVDLKVPHCKWFTLV